VPLAPTMVTADDGWARQLEPAAVAAAHSSLARVAATDGSVIIAAHVAPDGDALGGALALHLALTARGMHSLPTVGEHPMRIPAGLTALPGIDALVDPGSLPAPEAVALLITVDAASPERLGSIARYLAAGVPTLVIDHHAQGTPFGDIRLVAPGAAASVQVVVHLLDAIGAPLTADVATCLYAGLVTDTGRFSFAATDPSAHRFAARLLEAGVDHAELTRRLFDTRSLGQLRLLGRCLDRMVFVPDVALVHTHITHEELGFAGASGDALEAVVDLVRTADVAEVALVVKPDPDGGWRASLRSAGRVDVGALAATLGGGGHRVAAGFSATGTLDDVVAAVVAALREV
jgi:bifunctional oligoribonuclease and PAP phosphatase NrnA